MFFLPYKFLFSNAARFVWYKSLYFLDVFKIYLPLSLGNFVLFAPSAFTQKELNKSKSSILNDNKGKTGIYKWTKKQSGKSYIGSAIDLSKRLSNYFNPSYLKRETITNNSIIYKALLKYGYQCFTLENLEHCHVNILIEREQYYLDILKPEYNIAKHAGSVLGLKHTEASIEAIRKHKLGVPRTEPEKLTIANSSPNASSVVVTEIETGIVRYFSSIRSAANYIGTHHSYIAKCIKNNGIYAGSKYIIKPALASR